MCKIIHCPGPKTKGANSMAIYRKARRMECVFFVLLILLFPISCAVTRQHTQDTDTAAPSQDSNLKMQALVMDMADDYLA